MKEEKGKSKRKSKNKNKKILIIGIIAIIIVVLVIILVQRNKENSKESNTAGENVVENYVEEIDSGVKLNKSNKLNEAKEVEGLTIANIQLTLDSGITTLLADVTNNSGSKTNAKTVQITLLDYEGNELTTVPGIIKELEVGETTQLNISLTSDYVNAYDFRVKVT